MDNGNTLFPTSEQEVYLHSSIFGYFNFIIKETITEKIRSRIDEKEITRKDVEQIVSDIIKEHYEKWEKADNIPSIPKSHNKNIIDKYEKIIDKLIGEVFEKLPIDKSHRNQLKKIAASLFSKFPEGVGQADISGVVIAGFGEKDIFPSLESFFIEGMLDDKLKYKPHISRKIDFETNASIIPFAQREMVDTFMAGIDPDYRSIQEGYLSQTFKDYAGIVADHIKKYDAKEKRQLKEKLMGAGEEILKDLGKKLEDHRKERYISPVTNVVSILPKDELAAMAESLVSLTSFKRKVTMESETVGGPIDVAVISKGDGFIWIKRKHYFKPELNPQFFASYYKEV